MKKVIIFIIGFVLALGLNLLVGYLTQSYEWAGVPTVLYIIFSVAYWTGSNE